MALSQETIDKVKNYVKFRSPSVDTEAPEFDTALEIASDKYSKDCGAKYYIVLGLYILHLYELNSISSSNNGQSLSGPITEKKEGELMVKLGAEGSSGKSGMGELGRTGYGQELYAQLKACFSFTAQNINMNDITIIQ